MIKLNVFGTPDSNEFLKISKLHMIIDNNLKEYKIKNFQHE